MTTRLRCVDVEQVAAPLQFTETLTVRVSLNPPVTRL
jgi:hypothetical protein